MRLIDSNLFIYASKNQYRKILLPLLADAGSRATEFAKLESLGFHLLTAPEKIFLERAFTRMITISVSVTIIGKAIELRQQKKMSAGDAIHAATALLHNLELYTRNTADFAWIPGLQVVNPIP